MMIFHWLAIVMLLLSLVASEDVFNGECGDQLNNFLTCLLSSGVTEGTLTDVFQEGCQGCIESSYDANDSAAVSSCEDVVAVVSSSIDSCAQECAVEGCTDDVRAVFTCLSVLHSDCSSEASTPSASPSAVTNASSTTGFAAFMAVIQEVVPLVIAVLGSSGAGRRLIRT